MRKKILCAMFAATSICVSAYAATDVSMLDNKVTVETDIESGKWGTLIVTKSGDSLDDDNIIAMKQAKGDESGKAVFKISMPGTLEGGVNDKYDLHIKGGDGNVETESMYYALPADRTNMLEALKTESDIKTILEDENNEIPLKALGVCLDYYNDIKREDTINGDKGFRSLLLKMFIDERTVNVTDEEVISLLNGAIITQRINITADKSTEDIENLGFSFENIKYKDVDSGTKEFVCEYIYSNKPYTSVEKIRKAYNVANMLNVINSARFNEMEGKITGYAQELGIKDETAYLNYTRSSNKTAINEDIVSALKKKKAVSVSKLLSVIDKATKENSGKSGGSGGGGGTMSSSPNPLATIPVVNSNRDFEDIEDVAWAKVAISAMAEKGIVSGDENGNFNPYNAVKREEFVKMLVVATGMYKPDAKCTFSDVIDGAWYSSYVASAYNSNMVYGVSEKDFGIGANITRQDMAVMCYRAAEKLNVLKKERDGVQFADAGNISDYAKDAVVALYEAGAINGIGNDLFDPTGTATRAQAAVIIYNLFVR